MHFDDVIPREHVKGFLDSYSRTSYFLPGDGDKYACLFSFAILNNLLNTIDLPCDDVRAIRDNVYLEYKHPDELLAQIAKGATLIVNRIHVRSSQIRRLADSIAAKLKSPVSVNLYLSQSGYGAFGVHYDTHDVLVLQISGSKRWKVFKPSTPAPLFHMKHHDRIAPTDKAYREVMMRQGDTLYIPRGEWHSAMAEHEPSLHLTIGISAKTGIDFLAWLGRELSEVESWRTSFGPRREDQMNNLLDDLIDRLQNRTLSQKFFHASDLSIPYGTTFNLPAQFDDSNHQFRAGAIRRFIGYSDVSESAQELIVQFKNKKLTLHPSASALISALEQERVLTIEESVRLLSPIHAAVVHKLVHRLVIEGYAVLV